MNLFELDDNLPIQLLPHNGVVEYYGTVITSDESTKYFEKLLSMVSWKNDMAVIRGQQLTTKRKVAWYADQPYTYTYSNVTKTAQPWFSLLLELKDLVERACNENFNSCLLNLYSNGSEGMAWHCDAEKDLKRNGTIASLSFGAERKFSLKHKCTKEKIDVNLEHGSLIVMRGKTQSNWLHSIPKTKKVDTPRVNLTFRQIAT